MMFGLIFGDTLLNLPTGELKLVFHLTTCSCSDQWHVKRRKSATMIMPRFCPGRMIHFSTRLISAGSPALGALMFLLMIRLTRLEQLALLCRVMLTALGMMELVMQE